MIKVLNKAFDILEYLSHNPDSPQQLGVMSAELGMNQATCARILKTLSERHYADQPVSRGGYILGPMSYYLSKGRTFLNEITRISSPAVAECAALIGEYVTVSAFHQGKRYVLSHTNGNPAYQINMDIEESDDIYTTATGRLLLAYQSQEQIRAYILSKGLPGASWKGIRSEKALLDELASIRKQGFCIIDKERKESIVFSYPLFCGENVVASLGAAMLKANFKGKHKTLSLKTLKSYADKLSAAILKAH